MKGLVLGAGVIGTTAAYYLARDGHAVEVVDRQPGPRLETSYAYAGEVGPRLQRALGRPRGAGEGDQVDVDAAQPARHLAAARPRDVALGPGDAGRSRPRRRAPQGYT